MRMATESDNLIGSICVCSVGRIAIVTGKKALPFGEAWVGIGLDGKGTWASKEPCILEEKAQDFHDKLLERFGGKMSFNG